MQSNDHKRFIHFSLLILSYSSLFIFGMIDNGRGPAFPRLMESLNLTTAQAGWMFTASSIAALISGLLAHFWLKSIGPVRGFGIFFIMMGIGSLLTALAPQFSRPLGFYILILGGLIFGAGGSSSGICMNTMVGKAVSHHYLQKAYGALHTLYGVSSFCAPVLINLFIWMGYDWRLLFFITTGLCFIAGTITLTHFTKISSDNTLHKGSRPEISFISVSLAAIMGIYVAGEVLLSSRMAFYLENALHLDKVEAANYLSYFFASLLSGRLLTTISPIRLKSIGWPIGLMFCAALIYFLGSYHHPLFFCLTGFFIGPVFPLILTWMRNQFGEQADAIIPTAMNGVSIGVIVLHVVVGKLSSSIGISVIFESGPVIFLISALILAAVAYCASKNQERNRL